MHRPDPNGWALRMGGALPAAMLRWLLRAALRGQHLVLCLHRVDAPRAGGHHPAMNIGSAQLDAVLRALGDAGPDTLTVTFDDGYADAVAYVASRAMRLPGVRFGLFVCPEKSEQRIGYRWDADAIAVRAGTALVHPPPRQAWATEHQRPELRAAAREAAHALATVEELCAVARFGNVFLGNHTNTHLPLASLSPDQARFELAASTRDFQRLFGPMRHFAFPFGTPGSTFDAQHVAWARQLGAESIYSTEARTFVAPAPTVIPRLALDGTRTPEELLGWIAYRACVARLRPAEVLRLAEAPLDGEQRVAIPGGRRGPDAAGWVVNVPGEERTGRG